MCRSDVRQRLWAALALLALAAAVDSVTARPSMNLNTFRWLRSGQLQVCATPPQPISFNITERLSFVYEDYNGVQHSAQGVGNFNGIDILCEDFTVNISLIAFNMSSVYLLTSSEISGHAQLSMTVVPGVMESVFLSELNLTRVTNFGDYPVIGCVNTTGPSSVCYTTPVEEMCVQPPDNAEVKVCDSSTEILEVTNKTAIKSVELRYGFAESSGIFLIYEGNRTEFELFLITESGDGTFEMCTGADASCLFSDSATSGSETFTLKMTEIDRNEAVSSLTLEVKDLSVLTGLISHDTVSLEWSPDTATGSYEVFVSPPIVGRPPSYTAACTQPSPCRHFFIGLEVDLLNEYEVAIQVQGDTPTRIISKLAPLPELDEESMTIIGLSHSTRDQYQTMEMLTCFQHTDGERIARASLLLVDSKDNWNGLLDESVSYTATEYCFKTITLDAAKMDMDGVMRVMVYFEDDTSPTYTTFATQEDLYLFKPKFELRSQAIAKISWNNLNFGRYFTTRTPRDDSVQPELEVLCPQLTTCQYYVTDDDERGDKYSLLEMASVNQTSTVTLTVDNAINDLEVLVPFSTRQDNRLLVCFNDPPPSASRYELGVQRSGELVTSESNAAIVQYNGHSCAATSKAVLLGAYVNLWAVVTAYNSTGAILNAGDGFTRDLYLSSDRTVFIIVEQVAKSYQLVTAWKVVDSIEYLQNYTVRLLNEAGGVQEMATVDINTNDYTFTQIAEGYYTVCVTVSAVTPDSVEALVSEDTCSAVVHVAPDDGEIPPWEINKLNTFRKSSSGEVKISWGVDAEMFPEDVESLRVDWKSKSITSILQGHNVLTNIQSGTSSLADTRADSGFSIIPSTQTSIDLPLSSGTYSICFSPIKNFRAGQPQCQDLTLAAVDPDKKVDPPTQFVLSEEGVLSWVAPQIDETSPDTFSYFLESVQIGSVGKYLLTNSTSVNKTEIIGYGEWMVTVRSVNQDKIISDPSVTSITVNGDGIIIRYSQTGYRQATISWLDTHEQADPPEPQGYFVMFGGQGTYVICQVIDCFAVFVDNSAIAGVEFEVSVKPNTGPSAGTKESISFYFVDIGDVTVETAKSSSAGQRATIRWDPVLGASQYNVSYYNESGQLLYDNEDNIETAPFIYTVDVDSPISDSDYFTIQACTSGTRCGNTTRIGYPAPPPSGGDDNLLVILLPSLAAGLLLIVIVAGVMYKLSSDKKKKVLKDNDERDDISVASGRDNAAMQPELEQAGPAFARPDEQQQVFSPNDIPMTNQQSSGLFKSQPPIVQDISSHVVSQAPVATENRVFRPPTRVDMAERPFNQYPQMPEKPVPPPRTSRPRQRQVSVSPPRRSRWEQFEEKQRPHSSWENQPPRGGGYRQTIPYPGAAQHVRSDNVDRSSSMRPGPRPGQPGGERYNDPYYGPPPPRRARSQRPHQY